LSDTALVIPGPPDVHVHVNPVYALYHYLVRQGMEPDGEQAPGTAVAAEQAAQARHLLGVHGIWDSWEVPLASGPTVREAISGLRARMAETVNAMESALVGAEADFNERVWPQRVPIVAAALDTLRDTLAPHFARMAGRQGEMLGLIWPERIDAFLVTDCYDRRGAYSHPLTIDVRDNVGLTLCETVLHEATHVADVLTSTSGQSSLGSHLTERLQQAGISGPVAWNAWHAVIFAASADGVRAALNPEYTDYAVEHGLYDIFRLPDLPTLWHAYARGTMSETDFVQEVAIRLRAA
jgi:hypothetical protein